MCRKVCSIAACIVLLWGFGCCKNGGERAGTTVGAFLINTAKGGSALQRKEEPSIPALGEKEARNCPICDGPGCYEASGYVIDPEVIFKVKIALFLGTIVFFSLLFAYKKWSFLELPYETSTYFGPGAGSSASSSFIKPYGQSRSLNPIVSLTQSVLDVLDKVY